MARSSSIAATRLDPHGSGSKAGSGARRAAPTREEEVALAKRIEEANCRLVDAILRSPPAVDALVTLATEVRDGVADLEELVTAPLHDKDEQEEQAARILAAALRAQQQPKGRTRRTVSVREASAGPPSDDPASTLLLYGLSPTAVTRILARLTDLRARRRGSSVRLDATIQRIRESREEVDRAKAVLIEANTGLVVWMANKRAKTLLPFPDLVQEGMLGLMRAVDKFDWRRGVRFNTYAVWWIRHAINRALSDQSRIIRIPVHLLETRQKVVRVTQELSQQMGREPNVAELSQHTGLTVEKVRRASTLPPQPVSIDAPLREDGEATLGQAMADPKDVSVVDDISSRQLCARLRSLLSTLTAREQQVLRLRFGIDGAGTLTLSEIGKQLSLSRERIRQIEVEALAKLRVPATAEQLDAHLLHG